MQYLSTEVEGGACPLPDHMCIYYQLLLFIIIINNNTLHASLDSSDLCVRRRCRSAHDRVQWSHFLLTIESQPVFFNTLSPSMSWRCLKRRRTGDG